MQPYWFTFEAQPHPTPLDKGAGVTAHDEDDARRLVQHAFGDVAISSIAPLDEPDTLDHGHVRANMGDILRHGIWFPLGYEQGPDGDLR